jgi:hypothetical protein
VLRALEILLGLVLGCFGLLLSVAAVIGVVALFQKMLAGGDTPAVHFLVCLAPTLPALIFLAAWMLLRTPRASGIARRRVRWLAVASTGTTLTLLVAIAVPNFLRFGHDRPISSEPRIMLSVIRTAEESYFAEFGEYVAFNSVPSGPPGGPTPANQIEYPEGAKVLAWSFDEQGRPIWCRYAVAVGSATENGQAQAFTAEAICDIDGDGVFMAWGYVRPDRESGEAIPGPFGRCSTEGALDRSTGRPTPCVVGPCDEKSGSEVF